MGCCVGLRQGYASLRGLWFLLVLPHSNTGGRSAPAKVGRPPPLMRALGPIRGADCWERALSGPLAGRGDTSWSLSVLAVSALTSETHMISRRHLFTHLATHSRATTGTSWASSEKYIHLARRGGEFGVCQVEMNWSNWSPVERKHVGVRGGRSGWLHCKGATEDAHLDFSNKVSQVSQTCFHNREISSPVMGNDFWSTLSSNWKTKFSFENILSMQRRRVNRGQNPLIFVFD